MPIDGHVRVLEERVLAAEAWERRQEPTGGDAGAGFLVLVRMRGSSSPFPRRLQHSPDQMGSPMGQGPRCSAPRPARRRPPPGDPTREDTLPASVGRDRQPCTKPSAGARNKVLINCGVRKRTQGVGGNKGPTKRPAWPCALRPWWEPAATRPPPPANRTPRLLISASSASPARSAHPPLWATQVAQTPRGPARARAPPPPSRSRPSSTPPAAAGTPSLCIHAFSAPPPRPSAASTRRKHAHITKRSEMSTS